MILVTLPLPSYTRLVTVVRARCPRFTHTFTVRLRTVCLFYGGYGCLHTVVTHYTHTFTRCYARWFARCVAVCLTVVDSPHRAVGSVVAVYTRFGYGLRLLRVTVARIYAVTHLVVTDVPLRLDYVLITRALDARCRRVCLIWCVCATRVTR